MFVQGWGDEEDWEVGINRCKLLYIEWINNKVLLYSTDMNEALLRNQRGLWLGCREEKKVAGEGTSLVLQWLRLRAPNAGGPGSIPGQGTGPHMQQLKIPRAKMQIEDPMCGN